MTRRLGIDVLLERTTSSAGADAFFYVARSLESSPVPDRRWVRPRVRSCRRRSVLEHGRRLRPLFHLESGSRSPHPGGHPAHRLQPRHILPAWSGAKGRLYRLPLCGEEQLGVSFLEKHCNYQTLLDRDNRANLQRSSTSGQRQQGEAVRDTVQRMNKGAGGVTYSADGSCGCPTGGADTKRRGLHTCESQR